MEETKVLTEEERKKRREERRKRKKYRLLILLLLMFGTGVMLATSTYAWFTSNKTVSVNTLNVSIDAKNGIQISTDGTNWKSIVKTADITGARATYAASVNQLPEILEPVSTGGVVNANGKLEMYYGTIETSTSPTNNGEYILTAVPDVEHDNNDPDTPGTNGKFIAFDLFFKVSQDTPIYLTPNSGVKTDGVDSGIKNASRFAFIDLGTTADGSALATIQALNTSGASSPTYIWEPNYSSHTAAGIANANDVYKITTTDGGARVPYSGVISTIASSDDILLGKATATENGTKFKDVTITYQTKTGFTHYVPIFSLRAGITKIRIYMWVEGQDVDCENNASGGSIDFDLQITTEVPEGAATTES